MTKGIKVTDFLPFRPHERRMWKVEAVPLGRPMRRHIVSHQLAHSKIEAAQRCAWQAEANCDLYPDDPPYVWRVTPWPEDEPTDSAPGWSRKAESMNDEPEPWHPRPGTYYDW